MSPKWLGIGLLCLAGATHAEVIAVTTADDEDVELVGGFAAVVEAGVQGDPLGAGSAVGRGGRNVGHGGRGWMSGQGGCGIEGGGDGG